MSALPDNFQRIYRAVAAIPYGRVSSYGQIAARAGLPRRARLVGHALRNMPDDLELPWHRVITAQGKLAFPVDSEPYQRQRQRLAAEGIELLAGRVDLAAFGWQAAADELDRLLWQAD